VLHIDLHNLRCFSNSRTILCWPVRALRPCIGNTLLCICLNRISILLSDPIWGCNDRQFNVRDWDLKSFHNVCSHSYNLYLSLTKFARLYNTVYRYETTLALLCPSWGTEWGVLGAWSVAGYRWVLPCCFKQHDTFMNDCKIYYWFNQAECFISSKSSCKSNYQTITTTHASACV
jgi:hypothetical protein